MRRRLPQGTHLPHPRIAQTTGRRVEIRGRSGALPLEVDGVAGRRRRRVTVAVVPAAFLLVV